MDTGLKIDIFLGIFIAAGAYQESILIHDLICFLQFVSVLLHEETETNSLKYLSVLGYSGLDDSRLF